MSTPNTPSAPGFGGPPPRQVKSKKSTRVYLLATIVCVILAFFIVIVSTGGPEGKWALVARQSVPARTVLDIDLFEPRFVAEDAVVAGAITADSEEDVIKDAEKANLNGAIAQYPLPKGGQFTENLTSIETDLAQPLAPNERLISVPASYAVTLAGTVKVGDRVDVYAVGDSPTVANLVLGDVEVVAVSLPEDQVSSVYQRQLSAAEEGEELSASEALPTDPIPGVFTLRVPSERANALAVVAEHATIVLTFRGADATPTQMVPVDLLTVLCSVTLPAAVEGVTPEAAATQALASLPAECAQPVG